MLRARGDSTGRNSSPCKVNELHKMSVNGTFTWTEEPFVVFATASLALNKMYKVSSAAWYQRDRKLLGVRLFPLCVYSSAAINLQAFNRGAAWYRRDRKLLVGGATLRIVIPTPTCSYGEMADVVASSTTVERRVGSSPTMSTTSEYFSFLCKMGIERNV